VSRCCVLSCRSRWRRRRSASPASSDARRRRLRSPRSKAINVVSVAAAVSSGSSAKLASADRAAQALPRGRSGSTPGRPWAGATKLASASTTSVRVSVGARPRSPPSTCLCRRVRASTAAFEQIAGLVDRLAH
jgi:hypothetical protein